MSDHDRQMPRIVISTSSFAPANLAALQQLVEARFRVETNPFRRRLTENEIADLLGDETVGLIAGVEPLTAEVFDRAGALRIVSRCGVGLDSVDLDAAARRGVIVANTPDAPTQPVAELAIAHMLDLLREVSRADRQIRAGTWQPRMGGLLQGRVVGLLGFGRIGRRIADILLAFGVQLLVTDPALAGQDARLPTGVTAVGFERLLHESDILSLHVPYSESTHHIIDRQALALMKPTALLVNVARGGLVDESALHDALVSERLAGAGLDVFENEPYTGALATLDNVLMTAHMGSYAREARLAMERAAVDNLLVGLGQVGLLPEAGAV